MTCSFYSSGANARDVNDLRYNLFFAKNGEIESYQLPPCKDCLRKHTMGANYEACIWRRSLQCSPSILDPFGFRWKMGSSAEDESRLTIDWMDGKPAPEAVVELLACKCPRSCRLSDCVCMANVLTSTQTCVDCRIVKTKPHRRMWKSFFMEIAKRRMKVVTVRSPLIYLILHCYVPRPVSRPNCQFQRRIFNLFMH